VSSKLKVAILAVAVGGAALVARAMRRSLRTATALEDEERANHVGAGEALDVDGATRNELYEEAKRRGIRGRSRMTKAELQAALRKEFDR
jgi:hypothetical protein